MLVSVLVRVLVTVTVVVAVTVVLLVVTVALSAHAMLQRTKAKRMEPAFAAQHHKAQPRRMPCTCMATLHKPNKSPACGSALHQKLTAADVIHG